MVKTWNRQWTIYDKITVTAKINLLFKESLLQMIKGENYIWSQCTKDGYGTPFAFAGVVKGTHVDNRLRFAFPNSPAITEIELAFNDPTHKASIPYIEFENPVVV